MGISFGAVSPPQQAAPRRSQADGLAELLLAITQSRTQREQFRERMALERQQEERAAAESGERVKLTKEQAAREKAKFEQEEREKEADDIVANAVPGLLTIKGGKPEPSDFENLRARLIAEKPKLGGELNNAFNKQVGELQNFAKSYLDREKSELDLRVGKATEASTIARAKDEAKRSAILTRTAAIQERVAAAEERLGPGNRNGIISDMRLTGKPLGVIRRIYGVGPIDGVSDNATFDQLSGAKDADDDAMANNLRVAVEALKSLKDPGLGKAALTQLTTATIAKFPVDIFTDPYMSDDQKSAVPLYATIAQGLNRLVNGARGSDLDFANARRTVTIKDTDPPKVREQKFLMMTLLPEMLSGPPGVPMSTNIKTVLDRAQTAGVSMATLMPFRVIEERARANEKRGGDAPPPLSGTAGELFERRTR